MARYPKEHKRRVRRRIIDAAAAVLRAEGIEGAGVGTVMGRAGLTHGGFYAHFASKDELVAEGCAAGVAEAMRRVLEVGEAAPPEERVAAILSAYLTRERRDAADCTLATLACEIARQPPVVRERFTAAFRESIERTAELMAGDDDATRFDEALALLSGMVGALMLARAIADPVLSDRILGVGRRAVEGAVERARRGVSAGTGADSPAADRGPHIA